MKDVHDEQPTRRDFLQQAGHAAALAAFGTAAGCQWGRRAAPAPMTAASQEQPNVLFIIADQWRRQAFGFAGDPNLRTPNFDRLAAQGIVFDRSYTVCPICGPARAALWSGRYPHQTGVWSHHSPDAALRDEEFCMGEAFQRAGYNTGYIGKWHAMGTHHTKGLSHKEQQFIPPEKRQGFEWFEGYEVQHTTMFGPEFMGAWYYDNEGKYVETPSHVFEATMQTDHAIDYMRRHRDGKPFCLVLSWGPPHMPYTPPPAFDRFTPDMLQYQPNVPESARQDPNRQKELCGYYGLCEALDYEMGRLIEFLDTSGLSRNTVIVFTSDHGDHHGSQNMFYKGSIYEESVGVPLIVRWPGRIPTGRRTQTLVSTIDLMPTLLGLVGAPVPPSVSGRNLAPTCLGASQDASWLYIQGPGDSSRSLVTPRWKIQYAKGRVYHLTDPAEDPYELNEYKDNPAWANVREEATQQLFQVAEQTGDGFFKPGYVARRPQIPGRTLPTQPATNPAPAAPAR